ncbi:hypothetical protein HZH66_009059 [Vespula vulgaris]|uniref:Uncharacterized protein n=1 Tax=Vespula vulgaris TaxID=7454 RepID=A0A834JX68_VESVU|nr:hypothetical protein HZH66_009059 [Vespula vulgaris]
MGEIFTALDGLKLKASESVPVKHDESNDTHTDAATSICFYRLNGRTDERETLSRETRTYAGRVEKLKIEGSYRVNVESHVDSRALTWKQGCVNKRSAISRISCGVVRDDA